MSSFIGHYLFRLFSCGDRFKNAYTFLEIDCINLKVKFKTFCFILPHDVSAEDKNVHWFLRIIIWIEISRRHNAKWNFKVNNGYTNLEFSDAFLFMVILSIYLDTSSFSNLQNKSQWYFFFFLKTFHLQERQ